MGFLTPAGEFLRTRQGPDDRAVYEITLEPDDGYYPLPYMARQADGSAWEGDGTGPGADRKHSRQPFMPDGRRTFDEVDRLGIDERGHGNAISGQSGRRLLPHRALRRIHEGRAGRSRDRARALRARFLPVSSRPYRSFAAARDARAHHEQGSGDPRRRRLRRRNLDAGLTAHRGNHVLVPARARYRRADLRQCRPALSRHDLERRPEKPC